MQKETSSTLDSCVFFDIPQPDLDRSDYMSWLDNSLKKWMCDKEGNKEYQNCAPGKWELDGGIYGKIGGQWVRCKFYKLDGTRSFLMSHPNMRGVRIRDHYNMEGTVETVHHTAHRLEEFLQEEGIEYTRINPERHVL